MADELNDMGWDRRKNDAEWKETLMHTVFEIKTKLELHCGREEFYLDKLEKLDKKINGNGKVGIEEKVSFMWRALAATWIVAGGVIMSYILYVLKLK